MSRTPRFHGIALSVLLSGACLMLTACGAPQEPPAPRADAAAPADVIGAPLHEALDKAKSVEGLDSQHKSAIDDAVDQANRVLSRGGQDSA